MIITLKGADFSADNIGQVEIERTLNAYTLAAIEASGNAGLTDSQKFALDDLFLAMGVDGSNNVMSKMRKVYLPIIAGAVNKALVNYADNSFTNDKSDLSSDHWILRNHGLVGIDTTQGITLTLDNPLVGNNISFFMLRTELMENGVNDTSRNLILRGKTNDGLFIGPTNTSASDDDVVSLGTYGYNYNVNWGKDTDALKATAWNVQSASVRDAVLVGNVLETAAPIITTDMSGETSQTLYVYGLGSGQTTKAYGVSMIGEAVTKEQMLNICAKIDALYDAFVS